MINQYLTHEIVKFIHNIPHGFPMDGNYIGQLSENKWHQLAN
jgi:hypothetical protein